MKNKQINKPYWRMSLEELREATREFDKPMDLSKAKPLSPKMRARFRRAMNGPTYSIRVYGGKKRAVTVRLDEDLLDWSDRYARRHHLTRDELICRSLRSVQSFAH